MNLIPSSLFAVVKEVCRFMAAASMQRQESRMTATLR
jgi:hypothetical protein